MTEAGGVSGGGSQKVNDAGSLREMQRQREALKRVEAFPYSELLSSVMVSPVFTCPPSEPVCSVLSEMALRGISSVVAVDEAQRPTGILTERDILKNLASCGSTGFESALVSDFMTPHPVTLSVDDTIYRALSVLSTKGVKHLPLVDSGPGKTLMGMVTLRQLLKLRHPEPMTIISRLEDATTAGELRRLREEIPPMAARKLGMQISSHEIVTMISLINQDIHRKLMTLALERFGPPPAPFCLFVTGSHGRRENLLSPDQDHAMIIAENEGELQYDDYYIELTTWFSEALAEAGFETCPGYIMSQNPLWRKSIDEWKHQIDYWFSRQVPELGRFMTILFDAYPVYGSTDLFSDLSQFAHERLSEHKEVLRVMNEEISSHRAPLGFMKRFITERSGSHRGELDVKKSGLVFIVEGIRILALMKGVTRSDTVGRIGALVSEGHLHPDDGDYFEAAYEVLLHYALESQVRSALEGREINTYLDPRRLTARDRDMLRHSLKAINSLQELVANEFGTLVL